MIKIVSDGTAFNTRFYDEEGNELVALRSCCTAVHFAHIAGDVPKATLEVLCEAELTLPKGVTIIKHPLDQMVDRANGAMQ